MNILLVAVAVVVAVLWGPYTQYMARHRKAFGCGVGDRRLQTYDPDSGGTE